MKFNEIIGLNEDKGTGSFDYKYLFWGKKGTGYGVGYARQPIQLDIQQKGKEAIDALENIKNIIDALKSDDKKEFEVAERKIKANTKRISGVVDLLGSPIIISWLNGEPTSSIAVPQNRKGDVSDSRGRDIDVVKIFRDPATQELLTDVIDWDKVKIDDLQGDTQNTILAKFIMDVFSTKVNSANRRVYARSVGLENIMSTLNFKDDKKGIEIKPFSKTDYNLIPADSIGSKKVVPALKKIIQDNFAKVLKSARDAF